MDEVNRLSALKDSEINEAKKILAYEVTKQVHGEEEAQKAKQAAEALFGGGADDENMPTTQITKAQLEENGKIADIMVLAGLAKSKGEAKKLVLGGGVSIDGEKISDPFMDVVNCFEKGEIIIKKGKKVFHKVIVK